MSAFGGVCKRPKALLPRRTAKARCRLPSSFGFIFPDTTPAETRSGAARELAEAKRIAGAAHETTYLAVIAILEAHLLLRRGRIRKGLTAIADTFAGAPGRAFTMRPLIEVWKYLEILGGRKEGLRVRLELAEAEQIAATAEAEIAAAKAAGRIPWDGKICSVYESACVNQEDGKELFNIGALEFWSESVHAAELGLGLAKTLLNRGYIRDASWAARNALANPGALPRQRALARAFLANASAEMGSLEAVEAHLNEAKQIYASLDERLPLGAADTGLWHSIQSGDVAKAVEWAREFAASVVDLPAASGFCVETAAKIDSWGTSMAPVAAAFREAFASRFK